MRLLAALFLLQQLTSAHGFLRLGTVGVGGTSGTVYLIDSNSIFLFEFSATEAVIIQANSGVNATTSGALSSVNMMINANGNLLTSPTIEIRTVASGSLVINFQVPNNVYIPCNAEYLGRFARPFGGTYHALDGHVFLDRSARRFFVAGLDLDGSAPAAYFWLDTSTTPSSAGKIAAYNGVYARVSNVNNVDANVTIPPGYTSTVFRSLSVWCEAFTVSFGHVNIPTATADSFSCSTTFGPVTLGFSPARHSVSASVYVLGPTTIGFKNVNFDGTAPATWYWSGTTSTLSDGFIVPDHTGSLTKLGYLSNANVVLTLPAEYDVCNTNFISMYCVQASANFGDVRFSSEFGCSNCPTRCKTNTDTTIPGFQCKDLSTTSKVRLEYLYDSTNSLVTFKFHLCDVEASSYFAFGLSASNSGTAMSPNADVVVCQFSPTGLVNCTDYDLTIRSQCAITSGTYNGACPDHVLTGGVNNYINTQLETQNGITTFTTSRSINTGDSHDRVFTPGTPQYVIWAKGGTFSSPTNERWVLRHAPSNRATTVSPIQIDFAAASTCADVFECPTTTAAPVTPWNIPPLCVNSDNSNILAAIGNTGGKQGYKGTTGVDGWGIAWFLNGTLIPEVHVLRGTTVKFYVNGGNDPSDSALYHPFYLTSSNEGGIYSLFQASQPITETVYAGLNYDAGTGALTNLTVGPYCEWVETQGIGDNFNTFQEYRNTLTYSCAGNVGAGQFEWNTNANTPNLVYYQCATHRLLGWKIHVVDSLNSCWQSLGINITTPTVLVTSTAPVATTPATPTLPPSFQCKDLSTTKNVRVHYLYNSSNSMVTFKIQTCTLEANQYIAFGLSASNFGVSMVPNADVVVCYYTSGGTAVCTDYNLASRSSCFESGGSFSGACPDEQFTSGVNNYVDTSYENKDGVTTFTTTRPVATSDSRDTDFTPGTSQYVIWAMGTTFQGSGSIRWVSQHLSSNRASTVVPVQIDIGATSTCGLPLTCPTQAPFSSTVITSSAVVYTTPVATTSIAIVPTPAISTSSLVVATPAISTSSLVVPTQVSTSITIVPTPVATTPATTTPPPSFQCKDLSTTKNVRVHYLYNSSNSMVTFKIQTCTLEANQYIAFGLSASNFGVSMVPNADVVVCYYTSGGTAVCTDYNLASRSSCFESGGSFSGACPDEQFTSGVNNYVDTSYENKDGVTTFTTTRPVATSDSRDTDFTPGTSQYVIWAMGTTFQGSGSIRWVSQHLSSNRASTVVPVQIDIGATSTCGLPLTCPTQAPFTSTVITSSAVVYTTPVATTSIAIVPTPVATTPATPTLPPSFQCKDLSTTKNVRVHYLYNSSNSMVTFKIQTCTLEANQYIAFGLSASNFGVSMVPNADVVVCYYTSGGTAVCTDYNLASRSSCFESGGSFSGACPDEQFTSGVNNYVDTSYENKDGVTTFTTTRPVATSDSRDTDFTPGTSQYVIWAMGTTFQGSGSIRWVSQHLSSNRASTVVPVQIDIGATSTCGLPLTCPTQAPFTSTVITSSAVVYTTPVATTSIAIVPTPVATTPATTTPPPSFQCKDLSTTKNVRVHYLYNSSNSMVTFKIQTCTLEANQYIAFGLSASNFGVSMVPNADVVVCYYTSGGTAVCTDYNLASRSSCFESGGSFSGACPDEQFTSGVNNYVDTSYENKDGVTTFTTTRPVATSDSRDTDFTPGTSQYVIWAMGTTFQGSGSIRWVSQHLSSDRASPVVPVQIDIGATSTCNFPLTCPTQQPTGTKQTPQPTGTKQTPQPTGIMQTPQPWKIPPVCINSDSIVSVTIGNTQNLLTGNVTTDEVVWYINGLPRPEVYVTRNTQVTFVINGGDDRTDTVNYHPFYLTNSSKGGIIQITNANMSINETVYAGLVIQGNKPTQLTVGSSCKYTQTMSGDNFNSFNEYQDTLDFVCFGDIVEGKLVWKPDDNTPDTLYYQCAQHELHGGKIHVVEAIEDCVQQLGTGCLHVPYLLLFILALVLTVSFSF